ncbi:phosphoribosylanthranilate isomerase [Helicobacter sp. 23-1045]
MKIKFCGLFRECDIEFANELMPDFVGFVFARQSKRFVDFALAGELKARLNSGIKAVGVFVDSPVEHICEAVQSKIIDMVQLHGNENNAYISALRKSMQKDCGTIAPIIRAIKMRDSHSLNLALEFNADFILLDSANAGSGVAFEWEKLSAKIAESRYFAFDFATRFFLAGGVNADNLPRAMSLNPYAIDISSGIETQGKKDFAKMKQIIETLHSQNLR